MPSYRTNPASIYLLQDLDSFVEGQGLDKNRPSLEITAFSAIRVLMGEDFQKRLSESQQEESTYISDLLGALDRNATRLGYSKAPWIATGRPGLPVQWIMARFSRPHGASSPQVCMECRISTTSGLATRGVTRGVTTREANASGVMTSGDNSSKKAYASSFPTPLCLPSLLA